MGDLRDAGELSDGELNNLVDAYDTGTIDGNDLRRVSKLLDDSNDEYLYADDGSVDQLLEVENQGGDLSKTEIVVRDNDGEIRWMEPGDYDGGWLHITGRHILGSVDLNQQGGTSFFPLGQTVQGRQLPETLSTIELKELIYRTVKEGDPTTYNKKYYFEPTDNGYPYSGIDGMRVLVNDNGEIRTAYPLSGDAVRKWRPDLLDGRGGWEDIHDD